MLAPDALAPHHARARALVDGASALLFEQDAVVRRVVVGLLARGHVLLEGLPGLGKTELVKGLAALTGLAMKRVQFTPDLLPADITGSPVLEDGPEGRRLVFRAGPLFAPLVLADEINRASPKTQSALLEAMAERSVTVWDTSHPLPEPFFVLATQNPVELDGTYPLPEAQLDRFALKIAVGGVGPSAMRRLLVERPAGRPPAPEPVTDPGGLAETLDAVPAIVLPEAVADYIARLVDATHPDRDSAPELVRRHGRWGASPRAAIALAAVARAHALLEGRPSAGFDDVRALAPDVIAHRLVLGYEATLERVTARDLVAAALSHVPEVV